MKHFGKYVSTNFHQLRQNFGEEEGHALEFLLCYLKIGKRVYLNCACLLLNILIRVSLANILGIKSVFVSHKSI